MEYNLHFLCSVRCISKSTSCCIWIRRATLSRCHRSKWHHTGPVFVLLIQIAPAQQERKMKETCEMFLSMKQWLNEHRAECSYVFTGQEKLDGVMQCNIFALTTHRWAPKRQSPPLHPPPLFIGWNVRGSILFQIPSAWAFLSRTLVKWPRLMTRLFSRLYSTQPLHLETSPAWTERRNWLMMVSLTLELYHVTAFCV